MPHVLDLAACGGVPTAQIGGKALGLGRLLEHALEVPPGFVVTTEAYRTWMRAHGLQAAVDRLIADADDVTSLQAAAEGIARVFAGAPLESEEIDAAYRQLSPCDANAFVAVRSSATAEDGADASFAGAQDTHLWISGPSAVRRHIVRCWASLFSAPAIAYRRRLGSDPDQEAMAVVVQRMVCAHSAGVMFSLDPLSGDPSQITIESAFGLGSALVSGELTPDRYAVDKVTLEIRARTIAAKPFAERFVDGELRRVILDGGEATASSLSDDELVALARLAKRAEQHLHAGLDLEWALGPGPSGPRHIYLLQARPETVWSRARSAPQEADPPVTTSSALSRIALAMRKTSD